MSCSITISVIVLPERDQQIGEELPLAAGEAGGGLVEHQDLGLGGQRHASADLPVLAVRERADELGKLVVDRDAPRGLARARAVPGVAARDHRTKVAAVDADDRQVDVVLDGQAAEQSRDCW